jgi:hypothetical protein
LILLVQDFEGHSISICRGYPGKEHPKRHHPRRNFSRSKFVEGKQLRNVDWSRSDYFKNRRCGHKASFGSKFQLTPS